MDTDCLCRVQILLFWEMMDLEDGLGENKVIAILSKAGIK